MFGGVSIMGDGMPLKYFGPRVEGGVIDEFTECGEPWSSPGFTDKYLMMRHKHGVGT